MDATDESILREPYRPFWNIFGSKPILIKQYLSPYSIDVGAVF